MRKTMKIKQKKSPALMQGLFIMVRVGGVEPPTAWFVARYSIQLSYTRKIGKTSHS
jgi:hypothetical protein